MTRYIVRRILISIPILIGISAVVFILINLAPGDPIDALVDPLEMEVLSNEEVDRLREELGLNLPGPVRYFIWLRDVLSGNLGKSFHKRTPVSELIIKRLPITLGLVGAAIALGLTLGIIAGVISALRQYSITDMSFSLAAFFAVSIPEFFFALIFMFLFAVVLGWLPTFGMWTAGGEIGFNLDLIRHSILPILALALRDIAGYMRYTRASVLDALSGEYVTTALAKGLHPNVVLWKHVFRNALIPIVTIIGLGLPQLVGGAFIIENLFSWQGLGVLGYEAIVQRDYPVQMGVIMISAVAVVAANLLTDIVYAFIDPRIRH